MLKEASTESLARLTGDETGTTIDETRLDHAIEKSSAIVDSYLSGRYSLPLTQPIPILIASITADLTFAQLYTMQYHDTIVPDTIVQQKLNSISLLRELQRGNILLAGYEATRNAPPHIISNKTADDRLFTKDLLKQFKD